MSAHRSCVGEVLSGDGVEVVIGTDFSLLQESIAVEIRIIRINFCIIYWICFLIIIIIARRRCWFASNDVKVDI